MAQPKLEEILIDLSLKIGDGVSSASTNGEIFTSADRLKSVNEARRILFTELYESLGLDGLIKMFPEFISETGEIAKVQSGKVGCYSTPNGSGNSYTDSTRLLVIAAGNFTTGQTNFTTPAVFENALVQIISNTGNKYVMATNVEQVISSTTLKLRDAYGADIAQANLIAIVTAADETGYYPKPAEGRKFLEVINGGEIPVKEILSRMRFDSTKNAYSKFKGSTAFPKFFEDNKGVELSPDPYSTIRGNILLEPKTAVLGGSNPDIMEPGILLPYIKEIAAMVLLAEQQL